MGEYSPLIGIEIQIMLLPFTLNISTIMIIAFLVYGIEENNISTFLAAPILSYSLSRF